MTITKAGVTISGLNINGPIYIRANNVTIENCKVTSGDFSTINVLKGVTGTVVQDCEIDAQGGNGILGTGTFLRNNIYHAENGIALNGDNSLIEGNYIHDFRGAPTAHFDGIQIDGGNAHVVVRNNTVIVDQPGVSAVMIDNYFGPINDIVIDNNLLAGGGFPIYVDAHFNSNPITGVRITNNHLGEGGWGYVNFNQSSPTYTGNTFDGWTLFNALDDILGGGASPPPPPPPPPPVIVPATDGNDNIVGDAGNNTINALSGNDTVNGGAGNDTIIGGLGTDTLTGGPGNDIFVFRSAAEIGNTYSARDVITDFTPGQDKIDISAIDSNSGLTGNNDFIFLATNGAAFSGRAGELSWMTDASRDRTLVRADLNGDGVADFTLHLNGLINLKSTDFIGVTSASPPPPPASPPPPPPPTSTTVNGTQYADQLTGDAQNNIINGLGGDDRINAGAGNDTINGGFGRDVMTGGAGLDKFVFTATGEMGTTPWTRDVITDFTQGQDKIDLSAIDANSQASGNQAFTLLTADNAEFTHTAGQLAWRTDDVNDRTIIQGDTNGDGVHDFEIELAGVIDLRSTDFIL